MMTGRSFVWSLLMLTAGILLLAYAMAVLAP